MDKTGITLKQLKYWFINARRHILKRKHNEKLQNDKQSTTDPNNNVPVIVNACSPLAIYHNSPKIRFKEQINKFSQLQCTKNALTRLYLTLPPLQSILNNLNATSFSQQPTSFHHRDNLRLPPLGTETSHVRTPDAPMLAGYDTVATTFSLIKNFKPSLTS